MTVQCFLNLVDTAHGSAPIRGTQLCTFSSTGNERATDTTENIYGKKTEIRLTGTRMKLYRGHFLTIVWMRDIPFCRNFR